MRNAGLDEAQAGIKMAGRNINNSRCVSKDMHIFSSKELKSLLMKVKEREKGAPHPGRVCPSLWLSRPLAAEGKGAPHPWRGRPNLWLPGPLAAEGKDTWHPGKVRPSPWLPEPLRRGRHKTQAQPNPRFCGVPKTGTALNAGPAPYRAAGSQSSVDGESTDTPVRGKPSVAGTR